MFVMAPFAAGLLIFLYRVTRKEIRHFGIGGLCMRCEVCRYPICPFQK